MRVAIFIVEHNENINGAPYNVNRFSAKRGIKAKNCFRNVFYLSSGGLYRVEAIFSMTQTLSTLRLARDRYSFRISLSTAPVDDP